LTSVGNTDHAEYLNV